MSFGVESMMYVFFLKGFIFWEILIYFLRSKVR